MRFLRFAAVGISGVGVNLGSLAVMRWLGVQINLASALAIELSILSNFSLHHRWTFRDQREGPLATALARFHAVSLVGAALQLGTFIGLNQVWLTTFFGGQPTATDPLAAKMMQAFLAPPEVGSWIYLSQLVGIGLATVWNYLVNFHWTWAARRHGVGHG